MQFHESSLHFKLPVRINLYSNFNNTKKFFYLQVALFSKKFFYEEEEEDHACVKEMPLFPFDYREQSPIYDRFIFTTCAMTNDKLVFRSDFFPSPSRSLEISTSRVYFECDTYIITNVVNQSVLHKHTFTIGDIRTGKLLTLFQLSIVEVTIIDSC